MGLKSVSLVSICLFGTILHAAPVLRLVSSTVGPVSIAAGSNGPTQVVEAYNAGDGALTLTATPTDPATGQSVPWLQTSVLPSRNCTTTSLSRTCIPISFALNTAALPAGAATAIVTITAPNATDAPQNITVTVLIGGGIPNSITANLAPNGVLDLPIPTNSLLRSTATTQDKNPWLSLTLTGGGSFSFVFPYTIHLAPQPANLPGTYTGSLNISGSAFAADNKTVPVTMNVTTAPIVQGPAGPINIRQAQGAPPFAAASFNSVPLTIANLGQTPATFGTPTVSAGASWLTAAASPTGATLTVDSAAANLAPGNYSATVTVPTSASTGPVSTKVNLVVVPKGPPLIFFQGVLDNAAFNPGDALAPGDIAVVKGEQLSFSAFTSGPAPPLATKVADTSVLVNGVPAPLFYSFYNQIAFQIPTNTPIGTASVQVQRTDGTTSNTVSVGIAPRAPRIVVITDASYNLVNAAHPAAAGSTLILWTIGLGPTSPAVATGQAAPGAEPFARVTTTPAIRFGENPFSPTAVPFFAALSPGFAGLYQINVQVPPDAPKGDAVEVSVVFPDTTSNPISITIR